MVRPASVGQTGCSGSGRPESIALILATVIGLSPIIFVMLTKFALVILMGALYALVDGSLRGDETMQSHWLERKLKDAEISNI